MQGVSLATVGEISFKNGRPEQTNFDGYELTRIDASPAEIRTHLVNTTGFDKPMGGVGEPGVPAGRPGARQRNLTPLCGRRHPQPAHQEPARAEDMMGVKFEDE